MPDRLDTPVSAGHFRFSAWNLLLLVPLLMLITSWFNFDAPRLLGIPFFYWYQLAFVVVGVVCVGLVYVKTKHLRGGPGSPPTRPAPADLGDPGETR